MTEAASPRQRCVVAIALWGDSHILSFLDIHLPTLLAPGNIPDFAARIETRVLIYTRTRDIPLFEGNAMFARLRDYCAIEFKDIDAVGGDNPIAIHTAAWRDARAIAAGEKAYCFHLAPDVVWAERAWHFIANYMLSGKTAIYINWHVRVVDELFVDRFKKIKPRDDGTISIAPQALMKIATETSHPINAAYNINSSYFPHHPEMALYPVKDRGVLCQVFVLLPQILRADLHSVGANNTIVEGVPEENACVISDSDEAFMVSLTELAKDADWYAIRRHASPQSVGVWLMSYSDESIGIVPKKPFLLKFSDYKPSEWRRQEVEAKRFCAKSFIYRDLFLLSDYVLAKSLFRMKGVLENLLSRDDILDFRAPSGAFVIMAPSDQQVDGVRRKFLDAGMDASFLERYMTGAAKNLVMDKIRWDAIAEDLSAGASGGEDGVVLHQLCEGINVAIRSGCQLSSLNDSRSSIFLCTNIELVLDQDKMIKAATDAQVSPGTHSLGSHEDSSYPWMEDFKIGVAAADCDNYDFSASVLKNAVVIAPDIGFVRIAYARSLARVSEGFSALWHYNFSLHSFSRTAIDVEPERGGGGNTAIARDFFGYDILRVGHKYIAKQAGSVPGELPAKDAVVLRFQPDEGPLQEEKAATLHAADPATYLATRSGGVDRLITKVKALIGARAVRLLSGRLPAMRIRNAMVALALLFSGKGRRNKFSSFSDLISSIFGTEPNITLERPGRRGLVGWFRLLAATVLAHRSLVDECPEIPGGHSGYKIINSLKRFLAVRHIMPAAQAHIYLLTPIKIIMVEKVLRRYANLTNNDRVVRNFKAVFAQGAGTCGLDIENMLEPYKKHSSGVRSQDLYAASSIGEMQSLDINSDALLDFVDELPPELQDSNEIHLLNAMLFLRLVDDGAVISDDDRGRFLKSMIILSRKPGGLEQYNMPIADILEQNGYYAGALRLRRYATDWSHNVRPSLNVPLHARDQRVRDLINKYDGTVKSWSKKANLLFDALPLPGKTSVTPIGTEGGVELFVVVWGDWHMECLEEVMIPSILADGNLPELARRENVHIKFAATIQDYRRITKSAYFEKLKEYATVDVVVFSVSRNIPEELHLELWNEEIATVKNAGRLLLVVPPDVIFPSGALPNMIAPLRNGKWVVVAPPQLRVMSESIIPEAKNMARDGVIDLSPEETVAFGMDHMHFLSASSMEGANCGRPGIDRLWPVEGEGLYLFQSAREIIACDPSHADMTEKYLIKKDFDLGRVHFCTGLEDYFFLSLAPSVKDFGLLLPQFDTSSRFLSFWASHPENDNPMNTTLADHPIMLSNGNPERILSEKVGREVRAWVDDYLLWLRFFRAIAPCRIASIFVGHYALSAARVETVRELMKIESPLLFVIPFPENDGKAVPFADRRALIGALASGNGAALRDMARAHLAAIKDDFGAEPENVLQVGFLDGSKHEVEIRDGKPFRVGAFRVISSAEVSGDWVVIIDGLFRIPERSTS